MIEAPTIRKLQALIGNHAYDSFRLRRRPVATAAEAKALAYVYFEKEPGRRGGEPADARRGAARRH
jgi:hypothetical protein